MKQKFFTFIIIIFLIPFVFAKDNNVNLNAVPSTKEEKFFVEYLKEQTKTQKKLTLMHKKGTLTKLGEETVNGNLSGSLSYKTKISGLKGVVTISYNNYSDDSNWIFDGTIITTANMSQDGFFSGTMTVKGKYNAKIYYDNAKLQDGFAGGGTYGIQLDDGPVVQLPYTWYLIATAQ